LRRIVLLATADRTTNMVYHALAHEFGEIEVILEDSVPRTELLKRRYKRLGFLTLMGQVLFVLLVEKSQRKLTSARYKQICQQFGLNDAPIPRPVHRVPSVNSEEARRILKTLAPDIVVINGTRVISKATLDSVTAKFINTHAGITPTYRGVHGGYWALVDRHPELVGTTIHFVDKGIDTGQIINQAIFEPTAEDAFATYPILHVAVGLPILVQAVRGLVNGDLKLQDSISSLPSKLYSHPTLWAYLANRISLGVK
jgi:folate-dependent phosphoribosylglycinamide formyltransferase PurN